MPNTARGRGQGCLLGQRAGQRGEVYGYADVGGKQGLYGNFHLAPRSGVTTHFMESMTMYIGRRNFMLH